MIELGNFQQYQDYFKAIAEDHKELDATEAYLFGDIDVVNNKSRSWTGKKLWLQVPDPSQMEDDRSDNLLLRRPCSLVICGAAGSAKFQLEYDFYKACEIIAIDVVSRMRKDYTDATLKVVVDFPSMRFSWVELQAGATKLIGCQLDFAFKDPSGFAYNVSKWKSED